MAKREVRGKSLGNDGTYYFTRQRLMNCFPSKDVMMTVKEKNWATHSGSEGPEKPGVLSFFSLSTLMSPL